MGRELEPISRRVLVVGSLRNPVGPLPSTIYWRRRAVAATLVVLLALLVVWVVTSAGGGGGKGKGASDGANPAPSITPGPPGSGPAISEQPGGGGDSEGSGGSGDDGGDGSSGGSGGSGSDTGSGDGKNGGAEGGDTAGTGGSGSGSAGSGGSASGGGAGSGAGGGTGGGGTPGRQVPADSGLPNCPSSAISLRLLTSKVAYGPDEKPGFRLAVTNSSDTTCKTDLGPKAVVLTITDADDEQVWSSKDCAKDGRLLFEVPAGATVTRTVEWDRKQSRPECATPPAAPVGAGTYLVEAKAPGVSVEQGRQSIRLEKD